MNTFSHTKINNHKKRFVTIQKQFAFCFLLLDVFLFILFVVRMDFNPYFWYICIRIFLWALAFIFSKLRLSRQYYIPSLSEMSEIAYWSLTHVLLNLFTGLYIYFSYASSLNVNQIQSGFLVFNIFFLMAIYQQKPWMHYTIKYRKRRITELRRKAHITQEELLALKPFLLKEARKKQELPLYGRFLKWTIVFLSSILLSICSDMIVDLFYDSYIWNVIIGWILSR